MADDRPWVRAAVTARTRSHQAKVARARELITEFVEEHGRVIVAWSGGKDSTAVAALAGDLPGVHIAHFDCGLPYPGVAEWMAVTAGAMDWDWGSYRTGDALAELVGNGSWDHDAPTPAEAGNWWETIMAGPRQLAIDHWSAAAMMWGLRSDESRRRRLLLSRGLEFRDGDLGMPVLCPVGRFSTVDVWAVILNHGITVCPVYERLAEIGCPEASQRLDIMVGSDGRHFGRFVWLQRGWPDEFDRLRQSLPRVAEWV